MSSKNKPKTKPKTQATSTANASATKELKTRIEQLENENNKLRTELKQQLIDNREQNSNDDYYLRGLLGKELHDYSSEKEAQKALETMNAAVKEKEAAIIKLEEMTRKLKQVKEEEVEKLRKTYASNSPEKEAQKALETVNAAAKEKEDATNKLKEVEGKLKQVEEELVKLRKTNASENCALKERNEKLSTELLDVKRKHNELEKENVLLQRSCNEAFAKLKEKEIKNSQMEKEYKRVIEEINKIASFCLVVKTTAISKLDELEKDKVHHQNSQGNHDIGSDELTTGVADVCAFCASKGKLNPALYNCKGCTEFGRYICGCCKENHDLFTQHTAARIPTK